MWTFAQAAGGSGSPSNTAALVVSIIAASVAGTNLLWSLAQYRLSGARLRVELLPAALTLQGKLLRGQAGGWPSAVPTEFFAADRLYVDLAVIRVTNRGRFPVSVSDIALDFGRPKRLRRERLTMAGLPVLVDGCRAVDGEARLEVGQSISVAMDHLPLIEFAKHHGRHRLAVRATARRAGRRPSRSPRRRRWWVKDGAYLCPLESHPDRDAFVEVFRAVHQRDVSQLYEAWLGVTSLWLRDPEADRLEIAEELGRVLGVTSPFAYDLTVAAMRIIDKMPAELPIGMKTYKRGEFF